MFLNTGPGAIGLVSNLIINNSIEIDQVYEHKFNSIKTFKLFVHQKKIQILLKEYGFHNIQVQEICRNFDTRSTDLGLTENNRTNNIKHANLVHL